MNQNNFLMKSRSLMNSFYITIVIIFQFIFFIQLGYAKSEKSIEIDKLLKLAREDIKAERLITPVNSNAYKKLNKVLSLDSENKEAKAELNRMIDIYIQLAEEKMALGNRTLALKYLDRANTIIPNDNRILTTREKFRFTVKNIPELLKLARKDIENNHLMKPIQSNAYETLKTILSLDPDNPEAKAEQSRMIDIYIQLAEEKNTLGDKTLALKYLDRANIIIPDDSRILTARKIISGLDEESIAELLKLARKDIEENHLMKPPQSNAYEKLEKILSLDPDNQEAKAELSHMIKKYIQLAEEASFSGDWFQAKSYLSQAEKIIPNDERIKIAREKLHDPREVNIIELLNHAKADIKLNRLTSPPENNALDKFRKILKQVPNHKAALDGLNRLVDIQLHNFEKCLSSGDWNKAEYFMNQAININQNHNRVADARIKLKEYKDNRIKQLLKLARTDITNKRLTTPLGTNAYEKLQEIFSIEPENNEAKAELYRIVGIYIDFSEKSMSKNDTLNAKKYLDQAEMILPNDSRISQKRKELKSLNTDYLENKLKLAKHNLQKNQLKEAAINFKKVLDLDDDNTKAINGIKKVVDNYIMLANNKMGVGDWSKAKTYLNEVDIVLPGEKRVIDIRNKMKEWQKVSNNYRNFIQSNQFMIVKVRPNIELAKIVSDWLREKKIEFIELSVYNESDLGKFINKSYFFLDKRKKDLNNRDKLLLKYLTTNNYILYFFPSELNVSAIINQMPDDKKLLNNGIDYISVVYRDSNRPTGFNNISSYYLFSSSFQVKYSINAKVDKIESTLTSLNLKSHLIEKNQKNLIYKKFDFVEAQGVKVNIQSLISKLEECGIVEFATPFQIGPR